MSNINKHNTPHILIVAALAQESFPFIKMLHFTEQLDHNYVMGYWEELKISVLTCGVGIKPAKTRTSALLKQHSFDCILNVGTCGALNDNYPIGSLCTVSSITFEDEPSIIIQEDSSCTLVTALEVVADAQTRIQLATKADICDMEGYAIAQIVQDLTPKTPLYLFKVVSDLAGGEDDQAINLGTRSERLAVFKARTKQLSSLRLLPHTQSWLLKYKEQFAASL